jgi:hypothetical protein
MCLITSNNSGNMCLTAHMFCIEKLWAINDAYMITVIRYTLLRYIQNLFAQFHNSTFLPMKLVYVLICPDGLVTIGA